MNDEAVSDEDISGCCICLGVSMGHVLVGEFCGLLLRGWQGTEICVI